MAKKKDVHTAEKFKADVEAHLQESHVATFGAPFDGSKARKAIDKLDAVLDKFGPVLAALTPAQYRMWVELAASLIDKLDANLNGPDPAPAA